jgi:hypothetical protein
MGKNTMIPITENDDWVLAFNTWPEEMLDEDDDDPSNPPLLSYSVETIHVEDADLLVQEMSHLGACYEEDTTSEKDD